MITGIYINYKKWLSS